VIILGLVTLLLLASACVGIIVFGLGDLSTLTFIGATILLGAFTIMLFKSTILDVKKKAEPINQMILQKEKELEKHRSIVGLK
jgi:cell division protein FtsL